MKYLIVLLLCFLSVGKMTVQGLFGRKNVKTMADSIFFNGVIFIFSAALFSWKVAGCSAETWLFGAMFGVFSVIFQLVYTKAMSMGNVPLTVTISNLSVIIPITVSAAVFGERLSVLRIAGIILTVAAFIISTDFSRTGKTERGWLILALLAFLTNAGGTTVQKFYGKTAVAGEGQAFVACAYISAAVITVLVYFICSANGVRKTFPTSPKVFIYAAAVGVLLACFQAVNTYAAANIDGTFHYPVFTGTMMILSTVSGLIIFKDRLNRRQLAGIAVAIVAVVLTNF